MANMLLPKTPCCSKWESTVEICLVAGSDLELVTRPRDDLAKNSTAFLRDPKGARDATWRHGSIWMERDRRETTLPIEVSR